MTIELGFTRKEETAKAVNAIVFYRNRTNSSVFATAHDIADGMLLAGRAVNVHKLAISLMRSAKNDKIELIHPRCLFQEPGLLVWHRPSGVERLVFSKGGAKRVWLPPLVFIVRERRFYVFAYHGSRPTLETKLCHAPVLNRYELGDLCMGSMPIGTDVDSWEHSFFKSRFTNPHHQPKGYDALYTTRTPYNLRKLSPTGTTLGQQLNQMEKR